jgi:hypothetical protein
MDVSRAGRENRVPDHELPSLAFEALPRTLNGRQMENHHFIVYRAAVPGGWLVVTGIRDGGGATFVPDPEHAWDGGSVAVKRGRRVAAPLHFWAAGSEAHASALSCPDR